MKARKRDSNDEWKKVIYAQLEGSDILYKEQYLEFQPDTLSAELKTNDQVDIEKHWQDVRERAAIAALQGMLSNAGLVDEQYEYRVTIEKAALAYADELVKILKNGKT